MKIYVVQAGDTLSGIAESSGISIGLLMSLNGITESTKLAVGQTLVLRSAAETHRVEVGETVYSIARDYGISVRQLYQNNYFLAGRSELQAGQTLTIAFEDIPERTVDVNGYAYPHIRLPLLDSTLPYLTYLTPFTYGISAQGELVTLSDTELLAAAGQYRAASLMHLSSLTEDGHFSNERSSVLLGSSEMQEKLLREVVQNLRRKNYYGLDIDFEYVFPAEREAYAAFLSKARNRLNPLGYPVVAALAPKTNRQQQGLLYEAHDYALIGEAVNAVLLMTYEWGYTYGPPMAVAPIGQVRRVLDYAVTEIPPEKIFLGMPLYGYDWTLPYEQGITKAESISPYEAVMRAAQYGAEIGYDEESQAPFYRYFARSGREHIVWFEDARSARAKLELVEEYGLQGIGCWNLMRPFPQFWSVLNAMYDIETLL